MKNLIKNSLLFLCLNTLGLPLVQAQVTPPRVLKVASSKMGNYIYLAGEQEIAGKDTMVLKTTDHFIIKRMPFVLLTDSTKVKATLKNMKTIGIAKKATTEKELKELYSESDLADVRKFLAKNTNKEVLDFVANHIKAANYGFLYTVTETRRMLGHVYLDTDVKEGEMVYYQVIRVDQNKVEHPWGMALAQSKAGNYALPYLKPKLSFVRAKDSMVNIIWKLNIADATLNKIPKPTQRATVDPDGNLLTVPFLASALAGRVVTTLDGQPGPTTRVIAALNTSRDSLTFTYTAGLVKDKQFTAYLMPEDEIYNQGAHSDTVLTFGVDANSAPLLSSVNAKEIENGIQLTWPQLPAKPYLTGIQIWRYDTNDKLEKLTVMAPLDTVYTDYAITAGQNYRYQLKALFMPGIGVQQDVPAQATGTYTQFSKPLAAYGLEAKPSGNYVTLNWKANTDPAFYGYYVYRGTSPRQMDVIAGPVKERYYLDTAQSLNGRSQYYYAIMQQNLRQDTSDYSNVATVRPTKSLGIEPPRDVLFYYLNGVLRLQWDDVRKIDNAIETFLIQKKKKTDAEYSTYKVSDGKAFYLDSLIEQGIVYQYRVAAVAANGEVSAYSTASEFSRQKDKVATLNQFNLRNTSTGIEVSLPPVVYANRKGYHIFRKDISGGDFINVGMLKADEFIFVDSKTQTGQTYIYTITIIENDGREGDKGLSLSVKR